MSGPRAAACGRRSPEASDRSRRPPAPHGGPARPARTLERQLAGAHAQVVENAGGGGAEVVHVEHTRDAGRQHFTVQQAGRRRAGLLPVPLRDALMPVRIVAQLLRVLAVGVLQDGLDGGRRAQSLLLALLLALLLDPGPIVRVGRAVQRVLTRLVHKHPRRAGQGSHGVL